MTSTSGNLANNFARQPQRRQEWVGAGEQPLRDVQAWRLGSPQIDDQLELSQLLDRQIR